MSDLDGADIPYLTDDLPGIGGRLKVKPEDFRVVERPLYEPEGRGQHLYVRIRRSGMTTPDVQDRLEKLAGVDSVAIGYAGKKDRTAVVEQTFSIDLPGEPAEPVVEAIRGEEELHLLDHEWHKNKLQPGHLVGNAFEIVVRDVEVDDPVPAARQVIERLQREGLPNFYGSQRFGNDGDNASRGLRSIRGEHIDAPGWKRRLFEHACQSALFNRWLKTRIERGGFNELWAGDIAKKTDTGGLFTVEHLEDERPRFERGDITYTGPMYGGDLWWASDEAGELEREILEGAEVDAQTLESAGLSGSRRRARVVLGDVAINEADDDPGAVRFKFELPKGCYATVLLGEVMKVQNSGSGV